MNSICQMLRKLFVKKPQLRRLPGRYRMRDASFPMAIIYRMRGIFPGSVTRTHPQWIEPCKVDPTGAAVAPGMAVKINATGDAVTPFLAADTPTVIYGVVTRAYPWQPFVVNADGSQTTPVPVCDVLREGYIAVNTTGVPKKDANAYLNPTTGVFAAAAGTGISGPITNAHFNGPPDSAGVAELVVQLRTP